jgi:uncharacterized membrane protein
MKKDQLQTTLLLISPGAVLSLSVFLAGDPIVGIGILLSGGAAIFLFRNKIESLKEDKRVNEISQKASWATFQATVIGFAIGGASFIVLGKINSTYSNVGFFMAYVSSGVLVLYTLFYMYYNKREYLKLR